MNPRVNPDLLQPRAVAARPRCTLVGAGPGELELRAAAFAEHLAESSFTHLGVGRAG